MYGQIHDQINVANRILISHVRRMWPLHFDQLLCSRRSIMFFPCSLSSQVVRCFAAGIAIQHQQLLDEIVSTEIHQHCILAYAYPFKKKKFLHMHMHPRVHWSIISCWSMDPTFSRCIYTIYRKPRTTRCLQCNQRFSYINLV